MVTASTPEKDLNAIKTKAFGLSVKEVAPMEATSVTHLSATEVGDIINKIATNMQVTPQLALAAMYLLFLKGAANIKAPNSMQVEVLNEKKEPVLLSKLDLMAAYRRVTGNNFLRRLAESLAVEISQFAEANGLRGELATRINNKLLVSREVPLNEKEMAWASSYCQSLPNLALLSSDRLPGLLAEDYTQRFTEKSKGRNQPDGLKKARKGQKRKEERSAKTNTTT